MTRNDSFPAKYVTVSNLTIVEAIRYDGTPESADRIAAWLTATFPDTIVSTLDGVAGFWFVNPALTGSRPRLDVNGDYPWVVATADRFNGTPALSGAAVVSDAVFNRGWYRYPPPVLIATDTARDAVGHGWEFRSADNMIRNPGFDEYSVGSPATGDMIATVAVPAATARAAARRLRYLVESGIDARSDDELTAPADVLWPLPLETPEPRFAPGQRVTVRFVHQKDPTLRSPNVDHGEVLASLPPLFPGGSDRYIVGVYHRDDPEGQYGIAGSAEAASHDLTAVVDDPSDIPS